MKYINEIDNDFCQFMCNEGTLIEKKILSSSSILRENACLFLDDILMVSSKALDYVKNNGKCDKKIHLTSKQTIMLTKEILNDIDPKFNKLFNDFLEDGRILIFPKRKTKKIKDRLLKEGKYFQASCLSKEGYHVFCGYSKDDILVKCPLEGDISDVICIVHEIIHLYSRKHSFDAGNFTFLHKDSCFSEMPSIYFEKYAADYLVNKGFDRDSVYNLYIDRFINDSLLSVFYLEQLDVLNTYNRDGFVSSENLLHDERIFMIINNLLQIAFSYEQTSFEYIGYLNNINRILSEGNKKEWLNIWMASDDILKDYGFFKYILGRCFCSKLQQDEETKSKVLDIACDVCLPVTRVNDSDLMNRISSFLGMYEKSKKINESVKH